MLRHLASTPCENSLEIINNFLIFPLMKRYDRQGHSECVCAEMNKRSFMRARINISACLFHIFSDYKNVYIFLFIIAGHFLRRESFASKALTKLIFHFFRTEKVGDVSTECAYETCVI